MVQKRQDTGPDGPEPTGEQSGVPSRADEGAANRSSDITTLFENKAQAVKVRAIYWAMGLCCLGALYGGWSIFNSFGLSPADGGVLKPLGQRLTIGGFVAGMGVAAFVVMRLYAGLYVTRMERSGDLVGVQNLTLTGRRWHTIPAADFDLGEIYGEGRVFTSPGLSVYAPWRTLRVKGRWLPLILDLQAEHIDEKALAKLGFARLSS